MKLTFIIEYKKRRAIIDCEDCGHGSAWGETRAIAIFFDRNPDLDIAPAELSFKDNAAWHREHGLTITQ